MGCKHSKEMNRQINNNKVIRLCIELAGGTAVMFGFNRQPDGLGSPKRASAHICEELSSLH